MIAGEVVCQDYEIVRRVGEGSFGYVYQIKDRRTHQNYALKTDEKSATKMQLVNEIIVLKQIQNQIKQREMKETAEHQNKGHITKLIEYSCSQHGNRMVMSLHGENLFKLFEKCNRRFDSHTIYLVARAMLKNIEYLHRLGFVHKDVKPQNFVVGGYGFMGDTVGKEDDEIYLVDFGLARRFGQMDHKVIQQREINMEKRTIDQKPINHDKYQINQKMRGTPMYVSINVLLGIEAGPRDDLQAMMYVIVWMLKGRLPWHNMRITKKDLKELITSRISVHPDELFSTLPLLLKQIYLYIRTLQFEQTPDYRKIQKHLQGILSYKNQKIQEEYGGKYRKYCWEVVYQKQQSIKRRLQGSIKEEIVFEGREHEKMEQEKRFWLCG